ncbi:metastasis-associated MTA3-like protein [Sarcoptes scabiei]|uniref:Metastasis-associated MTA3-like protein n=1 Tax=Sarcoptes scabiei TaxID=52283 RepID=A0A132ADB6_SARSC|nr:metastasis-associated MTA3-like protein [Sarcoptes scabiei]
MLDIDFDSYWDEEARNPNRNRIRIGRQYQAQCPALLKSGQNDGRKLEDLETLTWNPNNPLNIHQLNQYFSIAKSIGLFIQAIDTCQDGIDEIECLEEEKCSTRPFQILDSGTKCILEAKPDRTVQSSNDNNNVINTSVSIPEKHQSDKVTTRQRIQHHHKSNHKEDSVEVTSQSSSNSSSSSSTTSNSLSTSPLKQTSNTRIQSIAKGLPAFILSHHSKNMREEKITDDDDYESKNNKGKNDDELQDSKCKFKSTTAEQAINLGSVEKYDVKKLANLLMGKWNATEAKVFAQAFNQCGKNFMAIKKDYLPWKSIRSIIEYYYLTCDKEKEELRKQRRNRAKSNRNCFSLNENRTNTTKPPSSSDNSDEINYESAKKFSTDIDGSNPKFNISQNSNQKSNDDRTRLSPNKQSNLSEQDLFNLMLMKGGLKNGNINLDAIADFTNSRFKFNNTNNNCNINGGNSAFIQSSSESKNSFVPGQEVRPVKAKPIFSQTDPSSSQLNEADSSKTNLGSLNLYLHGELVLRLNAQQQDSGQKWVESNEIQSSFKDDADDFSCGGADVSASDDDSLTSNESSSLVASSPSSSSTIATSSAKKSRVKLEHQNSNFPSNSQNSSISSPVSSHRNKNESNFNGGALNNPFPNTSQSLINSISALAAASSFLENPLSELEIKKRLFEYCQMGMSVEELQLLLASNLFPDPPKAHSNTPCLAATVPHIGTNVTDKTTTQNVSEKDSVYRSSPVKEHQRSSKSSSKQSKIVSNDLDNADNGYTNGFGPIDLTRRKSSINHNPFNSISNEMGSKNHSPKSKQSFSASTSNNLLNRSNCSLFSLPTLSSSSPSSLSSSTLSNPNGTGRNSTIVSPAKFSSNSHSSKSMKNNYNSKKKSSSSSSSSSISIAETNPF